MNETIEATLRLQFAQFLALADYRCGGEPHKNIVTQPECPACHRTVVDYLMLVPRSWPA
jgi:hypothetical protein